MIINPNPRVTVVRAQYHDQEAPFYRGNPFIEALPRVLSREEARDKMAYYPEYSSEERKLPSHIREHLASSLFLIRHPVGLHLDLEGRVSRLIRQGYLARNPANREFQTEISAREQVLRESRENGYFEIGEVTGREIPAATATGLTFLGISGIGKTAAVEMTLKLYPQLIIHSEYKGTPFTRTQVPWLGLQCPINGSPKTLCKNFFHAMDAIHAAAPVETDYVRDFVKRKSTTEELIFSMARLASQHGLGALILDEVQDLVPSGSRNILSFLVRLVNTLGIPVILVGGFDAASLLTEQFRQARRGATEGDMVIGRSEFGERWFEFCEAIWKYQYTRKETPLTPKLAKVLYEESAGITGYLIILYKMAQERAIVTGREEITVSLIRSVAKDGLVQARPILQSLKRKDKAALRRADLTLPEGMEARPLLRGDGPGSEKKSKRTRATSTRRTPSSGRRYGNPAQNSSVGTDSSDALSDGGVHSEGPSLAEITDQGDEKSAHESLSEAGITASNFWEAQSQSGDDTEGEENNAS
jgi:hypothetical protein